MSKSQDRDLTKKASQFESPWDLLRWMFARQWVGFVLVLALLWLVGSLLRPDFFPKWGNLFDLLRQMTPIGLVAVAMTYVIINKDIDLSVGSVFALATVVFGVLVKFQGMNAWAAAAVVLGVGLAAGLVNGLLATVFRLPAFIATLGMFFLARGLTLMLSGGFNIIGFPNSRPPNLHPFYLLGQSTSISHAGELNNMVWIFLGVALIGAFVLRWTVFGYKVYATGGNQEAAILAGINTHWVRIRAFLFSGFAAAVAGLINVAWIRRATPDVAVGFELLVIAAVVVGGTSLFGGRGSVLGSVLGTGILVIIRKIFTIGIIVGDEVRRLPQVGTLVFIGAIVLLAILIDIWVREERIFARLVARLRGIRLPERATFGVAGQLLGTRGQGAAGAGGGAREPNLFGRFFQAREAGIVIIVVALWFIGRWLRPDFFASSANTLGVLREIAQLGIIAVGMTYVIINADIDLSVGSVLAFSGVVWSVLVKWGGWNAWAAAAMVLVAGAVIGLTNGLLSTKLKLPAFVATLGMLFVARGAASWISRGGQLTQFPDSSFFLIAQENARLGGIPNQVLILLGIVIIGWLVLQRTTFGYQVYATGGNRDAAARAGINTDWVRIRAFIIVSALAALTALITVARVRSFAASLGQGLELRVIAAVIVGGTSLFGGRGSVLGAFLGAALIELIRNILFNGRLVDMQFGETVVKAVVTFNQRWLQIILGSLLLLVVVIDIWVREERILVRLWRWIRNRPWLAPPQAAEVGIRKR
ncbi:MAG: ABC transporter permease [Candidatus Bipolaricaulia bacterium]